MAKLCVFKTPYMFDLEQSIDRNMDQYLTGRGSFFSADQKGILTSSIEVSDDTPVLSPAIADDVENAIKLYEYLPIDETAASDPRLWCYLAHVVFKDYIVSRWKIGEGDSDKVLLRFFLNGNARSLHRQAISRLWWYAKLTVAPWEKSEALASLQKDDRYYYTAVLMRDEGLATDIIERPQLSSSPILLISILEFFDNHKELANRPFYREFLKEIILTLGYRKIHALSLNDLMAELNDIATEVNRRNLDTEAQ